MADMGVVALPRTLDFEAAVEEALVKVLGEGVAVSVAASEVLSVFDLSPEAEARLLQLGLARAVHIAKQNAQGGADPSREDESGPGFDLARLRARTQTRSPHGAQWAALAGTFYEVADGTQKPMLGWSVLDVEHVLATLRAHRIGVARREQFVEKNLLAALHEHGVSYVKDLPVEVIGGLDRRVARIWGRQ